MLQGQIREDLWSTSTGSPTIGTMTQTVIRPSSLSLQQLRDWLSLKQGTGQAMANSFPKEPFLAISKRQGCAKTFLLLYESCGFSQRRRSQPELYLSLCTLGMVSSSGLYVCVSADRLQWRTPQFRITTCQTAGDLSWHFHLRRPGHRRYR